MLGAGLAVLTVLSAMLMLWQWVAGVAFPLGRRRAIKGPLPAVTILKPVKGADPGTAEALESWLTQSYPGTYRVIFGVDSADDPAVVIIRDLLRRHTLTKASLLVCKERLGRNRKVNSLIQMARCARGSVIVLSDADVLAPPDLLTQIALPLEDPAIGLTHCLYRLADAPTPASRWEAFAVNADFWSQVLQHRCLGPLKYGLGAAMAVRRSDLDAIGGFMALADVLADDHWLGRRLVALGKRTELCTVPVDCTAAPSEWKEAWHHQLRWAITIRVCQPAAHALSLLANGTLWPLLWALAAPSRGALLLAGFLLLFRTIQGLDLESRFTKRPPDWRRFWLPALKDLLQIGLWAGAILKRQVTWRGHRFRVLHDGRLG
jgi:ceramide glucosyltransferase